MGKKISFFTKIIAVLGLAAFLVIFSYLQTVFGWTNPSQTPPGGSGILTAYNGKLGINAATPSTTLTVNGIISAVGNRIMDVATPIAGTDAVNKDYVDAQVGGGSGGTNTIVTLFGVGTDPGNPPGYLQGPAGAIPGACLGRFGPTWSSVCSAPTTNVPAGSGTPTCASLGTGWSEVMAGFGPMNSMFGWYGNNTAGGGETGNQNENDVPGSVAIGTDSICSTTSFAVMYASIYGQSAGNAGLLNSTAMLSACTTKYCNTCRICIKQ